MNVTSVYGALKKGMDNARNRLHDAFNKANDNQITDSPAVGAALDEEPPSI